MDKTEQNSSLIKSAMLLFTAMAMTRIIGAVLKIPLGNILGGTGLGYFSAAYSVFSPVYALTAAAIPTVITKLVAGNIALGNYRTVRKIRRVMLRFSLALGFFGAVLILVLSTPFALYIVNSPKSIPSMLVIAPALMFCCVSAVYKGYYEGLRDMIPTAASQVVESVVKAAIGIALSAFILAKTGSLPYAAAAAVFGVSVSELCGFAYLFIRSRARPDGITKEALLQSPEPERVLPLIIGIMKQMLPVTVGALVMNLGSFIDLISITNCINIAVTRDKAFFIEHFSYGLSGTLSGADGLSVTEIGNFVYGSYSGIVTSLFAIIPSMTSMLGKTALPGIAAAYERGDMTGLSKNIKFMLKGTFAIGLPLCWGLAVMAEPLLKLLYFSKPAEVAVSSLPLIILSAGGILLPLSSMVFSAFLAIGRADLQIKLMLMGSALKLAVNVVLIQIPEVNIAGAAVSTLVCYSAVSAGGLIILRGIIKKPLGTAGFFIRSAIPALLCAAAAFVLYNYLLPGEVHDALRLAFSAAAGALVYMTGVLIFDGAFVKRFFKLKR